LLYLPGNRSDGDRRAFFARLRDYHADPQQLKFSGQFGSTEVRLPVGATVWLLVLGVLFSIGWLTQPVVVVTIDRDKSLLQLSRKGGLATYPLQTIDLRQVRDVVVRSNQGTSGRETPSNAVLLEMNDGQLIAVTGRQLGGGARDFAQQLRAAIF